MAQTITSLPWNFMRGPGAPSSTGCVKYMSLARAEGAEVAVVGPALVEDVAHVSAARRSSRPVRSLSSRSSPSVNVASRPQGRDGPLPQNPAAAAAGDVERDDVPPPDPALATAWQSEATATSAAGSMSHALGCAKSRPGPGPPRCSRDT